MANNHDYWASPRQGGSWAVKRTGTRRAASIHNTQADAWKETRRLARGVGSEAFLKGRNGKILTRNSYVNDPHPPCG